MFKCLSSKGVFIQFSFSPTIEEEGTINDCDHSLEYQRALFTFNLLLRNIKNSIKYGDGERLLHCYRFALLYLKSTKRTKYSHTILKLLYRIKLQPEKAFQLTWGRFINTRGFKGKNIPPDLHLEHLNIFLKEL